jgi:hypothetical protein
MLPFDHLRSLSQMRQPAPVTLSRKIFDLRKTVDLRRTLDIRKILLPLDGRSRTYRVSKVYEDKAIRPVLDAEEVTVLLSTNAKG